MQTSTLGERKLTGLDFTRVTRFTAKGAMPPLADLLEHVTQSPRAGRNVPAHDLARP